MIHQEEHKLFKIYRIDNKSKWLVMKLPFNRPTLTPCSQCPFSVLFGHSKLSGISCSVHDIDCERHERYRRVNEEGSIIEI